MYFGSVKFYKHLIYFVIVLTLILAFIGLISVIRFFTSRSSDNQTSVSKLNYEDNTSNSDKNNGTQTNNNNIGGVNNSSKNPDTSNNSGTDSADKASTVEETNKTNNEKINTSEGSNIAGETSDSNNPDSSSDSIANDENTNLDDSNATNDESSSIDDDKSSEEDYTKLFPDLYGDKISGEIQDSKTAYFTFNDAPSTGTDELLNILERNDVKGTFFIVTGPTNSANLSKLKDIVDAGHSIGLYCNSRIYKELYSSVSSYLEDINTNYHTIYNETGVKPTVLRFPKGSKNEHNEKIYEELTAEVMRRNFRYYDWNVSLDNKGNELTSAEIYNNAIKDITKKDGEMLIISVNDDADNAATLVALEILIQALKDKGYSFGTLDNSIAQVVFSNK